MPALTTTPPADAVPVAFYDGHCLVCTDQAKKLGRIARGKLALRSFQDEGALDAFPGVTHDECMKELKLVAADGRVYGGAEAVVRALRIARPVLGRLALLYYLPGVSRLMNPLYRWIARNRYRLFGKRAACDSDACSIHLRP